MTIHEEIKNSDYVIYSDADILVSLDFDPISKGHVLILPQESYLDIDDLPFPILTKIFKAAQCYIKLAGQKFGGKGYSMMQNGGAYNDIDVFHLHVFLRFIEAEFGYKKENKSGAIDVEEFKEILKSELDRII